MRGKLAVVVVHFKRLSRQPGGMAIDGKVKFRPGFAEELAYRWISW